MDLSNEDLSEAQQVQLIRLLMRDNKENPLTGILACVKIKFKENANIHPWLRNLEQVSHQIAEDNDAQQLKSDYLSAYFFKFRLVTLGPALIIGAIIAITLATLFGVLIFGAPVLLPAIPFLAIPASIFFVTYLSGSLPTVFEKLLNKWVNNADNDIAQKFHTTISKYTLNPLANTEENSIELGELKLHLESYKLILKQVEPKNNHSSTVKLRLVKSENGEEMLTTKQPEYTYFPCLRDKKVPQLYFNRWKETFEVEVDGSTFSVNPKPQD